MSRSNRQYILTWIAVIVLIASTLTLVIVGLHTKLSYHFIFPLCGLLSIAAGIFLFLKASAFALQNFRKQLAEELNEKTSTRQKTTEERRELEELDVHGVAKKIVRKINPADNPELWGKELLSLLVNELELMSGIFYYKNQEEVFNAAATFAYPHTREPYSFREGEGLTGQAVKNKQAVIYRSIPDSYSKVFSGLGSGKPSYLAIIPLLLGDSVIAAIEAAGYKHSDENLEQLFQVVSRELAIKINEKTAREIHKEQALTKGEKADKKKPSTNGNLGKND